MKTVSSERGSAAMILSLVVTVLLLIGALVFGLWAYNGRQDYKNNVDQKIAVAVTTAKQQEDTVKDQQFAEESKSPLKTYVGPSDYGSLRLAYPKTWSGYVAQNDNSPFIDGYFAPDVVPSVADRDSVFALHVQVTSDSYSSVLANYTSGVSNGKVKVSPYRLPKVPGVVGSKITGTLQDGKNGTLILLPLRANALQIWTESDNYLHDLNKYILPNLTFSP